MSMERERNNIAEFGLLIEGASFSKEAETKCREILSAIMEECPLVLLKEIGHMVRAFRTRELDAENN